MDLPELAVDHGLQFVQGAGGVVAQAGLHDRPGALDRVEVRGVGGQPYDGQPVRSCAGEGAHRALTWVFRLSQIKMTGA